MKVLKGFKNVMNFIGDMARIHHDMETGRLKCPKCEQNTMSVYERGVMPVGICDNCNFEL